MPDKSIITCPQIVSDHIVYDPPGLQSARILRITANANGHAIGGIQPAGFEDGDELTIINVGAYYIRWLLNVPAEAPYFILGVGSDIILLPNQSFTVWRDWLSNRWRVL